MDDTPINTIDDAELHGWPWLELQCDCQTTLMPFELLRSRQRYRRLNEIVPRLRCQSCGRRPQYVGLFRMAGQHPVREPLKAQLRDGLQPAARASSTVQNHRSP